MMSEVDFLMQNKFSTMTFENKLQVSIYNHINLMNLFLSTTKANWRNLQSNQHFSASDFTKKKKKTVVECQCGDTVRTNAE